MAKSISRRSAFLLAAMAGTTAGAGNGDPDWQRKFRALLKQLNRFIEQQNDGIFDRAQWKRVEQAWKDLES